MHNGFRFASSNWIIARYEVPRGSPRSVESWSGLMVTFYLRSRASPSLVCWSGHR